MFLSLVVLSGSVLFAGDNFVFPDWEDQENTGKVSCSKNSDSSSLVDPFSLDGDNLTPPQRGVFVVKKTPPTSPKRSPKKIEKNSPSKYPKVIKSSALTALLKGSAVQKAAEEAAVTNQQTPQRRTLKRSTTVRNFSSMLPQVTVLPQPSTPAIAQAVAPQNQWSMTSGSLGDLDLDGIGMDDSDEDWVSI